MWPKAFAQFIELAPHISRLLPMADRFLQSKTATEDSGRRSLEAFSSGLQADLGRLSSAQSGIARQITALSESVAASGVDIRSTRTAMDSMEARFTGWETREAALGTRLAAVEGTLAGVDAQLQRMSERVRLGPVVLLLVLSNLILLAAVIALLVRGH